MAFKETELIEKYINAFNSHDLKYVLNCFDTEAVKIDANGKRYYGKDAIKEFYRLEFKQFPDCHCEIKAILGENGVGMVESIYTATNKNGNKQVCARGAEIIEFVNEKIKVIRDYHLVMS